MNGRRAIALLLLATACTPPAAPSRARQRTVAPEEALLDAIGIGDAAAVERLLDDGVSPEIHRQFMAAPSPTSFFEDKIAEDFTGRRL